MEGWPWDPQSYLLTVTTAPANGAMAPCLALRELYLYPGREVLPILDFSDRLSDLPKAMQFKKWDIQV